VGEVSESRQKRFDGLALPRTPPSLAVVDEVLAQEPVHRVQVPAVDRLVIEAAVLRIEDGLIAEAWDEADMLSVVQQLGVVPK
jgi:hypothetical protein